MLFGIKSPVLSTVFLIHIVKCIKNKKEINVARQGEIHFKRQDKFSV
jgi:hypothetical protein